MCMSGVLLNRSSCSLRTSSLIVAVRQPPFAFFFVDLIITNSLGPINLFWLFGRSHHRWSVMVSLLYGRERGVPNICGCVYNTLTHGRQGLALLCQHMSKQGGTMSTDVSVLDCFEVREPLVKTEGKYLSRWISTTVEVAATAES